MLEISFICKFLSISLLPNTYSDPHSQNGFGKAKSMRIRIHSTGFLVKILTRLPDLGKSEKFTHLIFTGNQNFVNKLLNTSAVHANL
jgi:hypothetical protein